MSPSQQSLALRLMVALGIAMALAGVVFNFINGAAGSASSLNFLAMVPFAWVVWVLAPTEFENKLIWILAALVLLVGVYPLGTSIADFVWPLAEMPEPGAPIPDDLPTAFLSLIRLSEALSSTGLILLLTLGLLLFPDGRLPSLRWKWIARLSGGVVLMWSAISLWAAVPGNAAFMNGSVAGLVYLLAMFSGPVCVSSVVFRYRSADADVRAQIRWIVFGAVVVVISSVISFSGGPEVVGILGLAAFGTTYAVAVSKYRLYDVDVFLSRTVVLAVLAGFITATYALVVVGVGTLIGGESDGLFLPIAATALVALAFEPVRIRSQHWANKLVYGKRATPYEVLADLTGRLSASGEGRGMVARMAEMLREGTGADRVTVWYGKPGSLVEGATSPDGAEPALEPAVGEPTAFPVEHDGEVVGALEVVKPKGTALSSSERSLISDLAGSVGAVLGYQRLNDSLAARARDLEASRQRLVEAQGLERRRLERELHEGAEQYIVALKVKLGVASQLAKRQGAAALENLLAGLTDEAQAALDDVRALAKGIYPPVLESDGLGAAVSALAASTPVDVQVSKDGVGRYPIDVEAAVYFDISEAITNAVKHAEAPILVDLDESQGVLRFSVRDSGPGFRLDAYEAGSGLENMVDRMGAVGGQLTIDSAPGSYTEVSGSVPVQTDVSTEGSNSDLETNATAPASLALDSYSAGS